MAHAFDTSLRWTGTATTLASSYTTGATATVVALGIVVAGGTARAGGVPTWAGKGMTQANSSQKAASSPETVSELWYYLNPVVGKKTISVPNSGGLRTFIQASSYKAAHGYVSRLDYTGGENATGANPSVSCTVTVGGDVIVAVCGDGYTSVPSGRTGTSINEIDDGAYTDSNQYRLYSTNSGTYASTWTNISDDWGAVCASFKQATIVANTSTKTETFTMTAPQTSQAKYYLSPTETLSASENKSATRGTYLALWAKRSAGQGT